MQNTLETWIDYFNDRDLPVFKSSLDALKVMKKLDDLDFTKLAGIVLPDPMLTLKVMKAVSVGRKSGFAQPVTKVENAAMLLGSTAFFNKLESAACFETTLPNEVQNGLLRVVTRTYHAAMQIRDWALYRLDTNVEEMYIATLLQDLGEMYMWTADPTLMKRFATIHRNQGYEIASQEIFPSGFDSLTLGLSLAWNLPPLITSAQRASDCETHPRARLVMLAKRLARNAEYGWHNPALMTDYEEIAETLHLSVDDVIERIHKNAILAANNRSFSGMPSAASWLPMLPGAWPDDEVVEVHKVMIESTTQANPEVIVSDQSQLNKTNASIPVESATKEFAKHSFDQVMKHMIDHMDNSLTFNHLLKIVVDGMQNGLGLKRVVFALLTQDRGTLRSRIVAGVKEDSPLKNFIFDMQQPHLFSRLLLKQQAFWLSDENRIKYKPLMSGDFATHIDSPHFFAMSTAVRGKMIGMFYADCDGEGLNAEQFNYFKQLCTQASLSLGYLAKV